MVASFYKWLIVPCLFFMGTGSSLHKADRWELPAPGSSMSFSSTHPFYVTVTEINHNAAAKTLEISCKIFTDDMEKTLKQNYKTNVDIIQPKDKAFLIKMLTEYLKNRLKISVDGKVANLEYVGYEIDESAAYVYLQIENLPTVKKIDIINSLLYDFIDKQANIMHVVVNGNRKSTKLEYPNTKAAFEW